jgi:hypothetical protein
MMAETLLFLPLTIGGIENPPMAAALKFGVDGPFRNVPPQFGYWLGGLRQARSRHSALDVAGRP